MLHAVKPSFSCTAETIPEIQLQSEVSARRHNEALLCTSFSDPGESALVEGLALHQGLVLRLEFEQAGSGFFADGLLEAADLLATIILQTCLPHLTNGQCMFKRMCVYVCNEKL